MSSKQAENAPRAVLLSCVAWDLTTPFESSVVDARLEFLGCMHLSKLQTILHNCISNR
jgi:hypothetical protein